MTKVPFIIAAMYISSISSNIFIYTIISIPAFHIVCKEKYFIHQPVPEKIKILISPNKNCLRYAFRYDHAHEYGLNESADAHGHALSCSVA
jgi:hypothetical protein